MATKATEIHYIIILKFQGLINTNLHEECPLGKLFRPSATNLGCPVHSISLFISPAKDVQSILSNLIKIQASHTPFGKHRQKKSGRGRPTISLMVSVRTPLRGMASVKPRIASTYSFLSLLPNSKKCSVKTSSGRIITTTIRYRTGT